MLVALLAPLGIELGAVTLAPESEDATEVVRATADLVLGSSDPPLSVVVENQRRIDRDKPFAWMRYLAVVHARRRCPTFLVVFTTDPDVAAWAASPITTFQPGSRVAPIVLGPGSVPRVASAEEARRSPELALLSVMAHGRSDVGETIARAALVGAAALDDEKYRLYTDRILAALAPIVSSKLEDEMKAGAIEYESRLFRDLIAKGREEGERAVLERQLAKRFGPLPEWARHKLAGARADLLERWAERVLDAPTMEEALRD
ncbi:MAG: DUF4351 domain-containing protein [Myxococcota bacterium]|nr:DUF4351 domain-containing protein [Myxococcota bacterium]